MVYLESPSTDPYFNLALEQYVFDCLPRDREYFMLWQNDNTIVVGKHQNTAEEINADFVRTHGVRVVRRLSGGGAVYHDLGNLNFTFVMDAGADSALDLHLFCQPVARALQKLGVDAQVNGRNDITIDGQKFSGNAQYRKQGRIMHHGTLMFDSDLSVVAQALQVSQDKIESKGIPSVRSRVTTIRPYLRQDVSEKFKALLLDGHVQGTPWSPIRHHTGPGRVQALRDSRYATWEWNFGAAPKCRAYAPPGGGRWRHRGLLVGRQGRIASATSARLLLRRGFRPPVRPADGACL
jgi:lipoate-protein ligase A